MFTPRHKPDDSLLGHLTFALKHEGIDLGVLKCLFDGTEPQTIAEIVRREPTGAYSRTRGFCPLIRERKSSIVYCAQFVPGGAFDSKEADNWRRFPLSNN